MLVLELVAHQFESILVKMYGKNHRTGGMLFNAIICLFAMIFSFVTDKGTLQFPAGVVIYGLVNSTMYAVGFYAGFLAFKTGSFGLTKLFSLVIYNYLPISLVSPAKAGLGVVFGFLVSMVFFKEKFSCRQIISVFIGIAAVVIMSL